MVALLAAIHSKDLVVLAATDKMYTSTSAVATLAIWATSLVLCLVVVVVNAEHVVAM